MVFPVVMYGCESWTVKKAEHQRIDAFELWCWRRLLRVPSTARRSNQSILKEISSGCSLEGLMLKLKLQYFVHLMQRAASFEKTLMLGGIGGRRRGDDRGWDGWMASPTRCTWVWVNSRSWWWTGRLGMLHAGHGVAKSRTRLSNWTNLWEKWMCFLDIIIWHFISLPLLKWNSSLNSFSTQMDFDIEFFFILNVNLYHSCDTVFSLTPFSIC